MAVKFLVKAGTNPAYGHASSPQVAFTMLHGLVSEYREALEAHDKAEHLAPAWEQFEGELLQEALKPWLPYDREVLIEGPDEMFWGYKPVDE